VFCISHAGHVVRFMSLIYWTQRRLVRPSQAAQITRMISCHAKCCKHLARTGAGAIGMRDPVVEDPVPEYVRGVSAC
jgi:hypothetical protein